MFNDEVSILAISKKWKMPGAQCLADYLIDANEFEKVSELQTIKTQKLTCRLKRY